MSRPLSIADAIALAAFLTVGAILIERNRALDIEAPETATRLVSAATVAPSCQDMLENRRFVIRRMMIADGSLVLGNSWRNDALLGACPAN